MLSLFYIDVEIPIWVFSFFSLYDGDVLGTDDSRIITNPNFSWRMNPPVSFGGLLMTVRYDPRNEHFSGRLDVSEPVCRYANVSRLVTSARIV